MADAITLHEGDCLDVLAAMPAASVDAVVTDPPYHLTSIVARFGADAAAPARPGRAAHHTGAYARASAGFMGQKWDGGDIAFRVETWAAVRRVLKPGGHLVAFNHSRTWHRMATAIDAAGFETRDSVLRLYDSGAAWGAFLDSLSPDQRDGLGRAMAGADAPLLAWIYGTGFPKSHNVAAAIAKARDDRAAVLRITGFLRDAAARAGITAAAIDAHFGRRGMAGHWTSTAAQPAIPSPEEWAALKSLLGFGDEMDAEFARLAARKGKPGDDWAAAPVTGAHETAAGAARWRNRYDDNRAGGAPGSAREIRSIDHLAEAATWAGWGTALAPAFEPIILARKPLDAGSVARQVLATGTGALNIDAARIPATGDNRVANLGGGPADGALTRSAGWDRPWMHDPAAAAESRARSDASIARAERLGRWPANVVHDGSPATTRHFPRDGGAGAQSFFYSAKADRRDRRGSDHPTVKPQSLMRWLVRLVSAEGGVVLDPFAGSGATGWAAATEGRRAILVEREPKYAAHIRALITRDAERPEAPDPDNAAEPRLL